jgi:NADH:ubiquinone oxidoreductase subunit 3 (subunit A)
MKLDAATWGAALWPAFLGAAVGDAILFTLIDPETIVLFGVHADISRPAAYTIGFFVLWLLIITTSVTTLWLSDHRRK